MFRPILEHKLETNKSKNNPTLRYSDGSQIEALDIYSTKPITKGKLEKHIVKGKRKLKCQK